MSCMICLKSVYYFKMSCFIVQIQRQCATTLQPYFATNSLVSKCLDHGSNLEHVMDYTRLRALGTLFSMLNQAVRNVLTYNHNHSDFPMQVIDSLDSIGTPLLRLVSAIK